MRILEIIPPDEKLAEFPEPQRSEEEPTSAGEKNR
jgi:hypothetical protein